MMQRITIIVLSLILVLSFFGLFVNAIHTEINREYSPPPKEHAPKAYENAHKVKWQRVICGKCHVDPNAEFIKRVEQVKDSNDAE